MDTRIVHVVTLVDRHFDDLTTPHESDEGAGLRVAFIKEQYADRMHGTKWRWDERSKTWSYCDDGPRIRVERKELQP